MKKNTIIIGIAGASASGKSLLANTIVSELGSDQVVVIPEDSYYKEQSSLTLEERAFVNYDHPNAFDHDLLCKHLANLQQGIAVELPLYDYTVHNRSKLTRTIGSHKIIVLEGIMLLVDPALRELLDIRIFMDAPLDICLLRRLQRDVIKRGRTIESVLEQYEANVRPMFLQFIEPSKRYADIIVPRGGENRIAIDMIKAKMHNLLNGIE
ncbi:MAG: uridine kinase [Legionellales bacterium]|nr:uridine kinase [Legionellales bacterium]